MFEQKQPAAKFNTGDQADYERMKARGAEFTTPHGRDGIEDRGGQ